MAQVVELKDGMNHHPAHPGIWVPYTGWRLKDRYDIKLKTGEVWRYYYPNGGSFAKWTSDHEGPDRVEDDEIAEIRQMLDEEITEEYYFKGKDRLDRNVKMFGDVLPTVNIAEDGTVTFTPIKRRIFDDWVLSTWSGEEAMWLHVNELSVEELKTQLSERHNDIEPNTDLGDSLRSYLNVLCKKANHTDAHVQVAWKTSTLPFNLESPTDYQPAVCLCAVKTLEEMAAIQIEKDRVEQVEANRIASLGFTPTGKAMRRRVAVSALAAHMTTPHLHRAIDRKVSGGGKNEKDGRFVTKSEMRSVDGKKLTGKQLRKMQKKMRQAERDKVVVDGTE